MLSVRSLNPPDDLSLLATVHGWVRGSARWLRESQDVWGRKDFGPFVLEHFEGRITFGLFRGGKLFAAVSLDSCGRGLYECHLAAGKGAGGVDVAVGAEALKEKVFAAGAKELFAWIDSKNVGVRRVLNSCGFRDAGLVMLKGARRGRLVEWRLMVTKGVEDVEQAEDGADAVQPAEYLQLANDAGHLRRVGAQGHEVRG